MSRARGEDIVGNKVERRGREKAGRRGGEEDAARRVLQREEEARRGGQGLQRKTV